MRNLQEKNRRGFTLVEVLVVVGIISLLATIVIVNMRAPQIRAKLQATKADILLLETAIEQYKSDLGSYPPRDKLIRALEQGLAGSIRWKGPYFDFKDSRVAFTSPTGEVLNKYRDRGIKQLSFYDGTNAELFVLPPSGEVYIDHFDRPIVYVPSRDYEPTNAMVDENETFYGNFQIYSFGHDGHSFLDAGRLHLLLWDDNIDNDQDGLTDRADNMDTTRTAPAAPGIAAPEAVEDDIANWE
jgi:prepilin-type N-terminal cleavage/methylation domain-containing protein